MRSTREAMLFNRDTYKWIKQRWYWSIKLFELPAALSFCLHVSFEMKLPWLEAWDPSLLWARNKITSVVTYYHNMCDNSHKAWDGVQFGVNITWKESVINSAGVEISFKLQSNSNYSLGSWLILERTGHIKRILIKSSVFSNTHNKNPSTKSCWMYQFLAADGRYSCLKNMSTFQYSLLPTKVWLEHIWKYTRK